jgi:AbiV family abortive infection protein
MGWLYWALTLAHDAEHKWKRFWRAFYSHADKNDIGRRMLHHGTTPDLLIQIVHFFEYDLSLCAVAPKQLDVFKQSILYVDFDEDSGTFVGPEEHLAKPKIDTSSLEWELGTLIRYVARNQKHGVFDLETMERFQQIHSGTQDYSERTALLHSLQDELLSSGDAPAVEAVPHQWP